jgi:type VI secretion system protein ImpA
MALSTEFDLDQLLAPFPGDHSAGADPRADDSTVDLRSIRDLRDDARRIEREADNNGEEPIEAWPLWREVRDRSIQILAEQSKDLEVASYLIESLVRTDGFEGLKQGLRLIRGLVQDLWDHVYPLPNPEEQDEDSRVLERLRALTRLNGVDAAGLLPPVLARVHITEGATVGPFACWHYRQAVELAKKPPDEQTRRINDGAVSMEKLDRAVSETSPQFFVQLLESLNGSLAELKQLDDALTEKCGRAAPSWSAIREELEECIRILKLIAKGRLPEDGAAATDAAATGAPGPDGKPFSTTGGLNSREDAFRMLELVAAYFERMDPQSLLALQIRKVIRLGRMTSEEYFRELLNDDNAFRELMRTVRGNSEQS